MAIVTRVAVGGRRRSDTCPRQFGVRQARYFPQPHFTYGRRSGYPTGSGTRSGGVSSVSRTTGGRA
jgi:hypothetical protein